MTSVRTAESFEMGRVLSRAFGAMGRNLALFLALAVILSGIPHLIGGLWRLAVQDPAQQFSGPSVIAAVVGGLIGFIGSAILQVALTRATVSDLVGETPGFGACMRGAIALALPMIGLTIVATLGVGLATLLLIVPGIMLFIAWSVAVPAYVQERIGVFDSLARSRALTKGARWKIFGLFLIYTIVIMILGIPAGMLAVLLHAPPYVAVVFTTILSAVGAMVIVTIQATIYVELRDVKEGVSPKDLEAIFA